MNRLDHDFAPIIGARLRELRLSRGLTAAGLARLCESDHSWIIRLESGHHTPTIATIATYAAACGYHVFDVLSCLDPKTTRLPDAAPTASSRRGESQARAAEPSAAPEAPDLTTTGGAL